MTPMDVLLDLLARADRGHVAAADVRHEDVREWPAGVFEILVDCQILVAGEPATSVVCPACDDEHWEVPLVIPGGGSRGARAYINCPAYGRQAIGLSSLRQWRMSVEGLAKALARELDNGLGVREAVPEQVWTLGAIDTTSGRRPAYLVRSGGQSPRLQETVGRLLEGSTLVPVIFTLARYRQLAVDKAAAVIPLPDVIAFGVQGVRLDLRAIVGDPGPTTDKESRDNGHQLSHGRPPVPFHVWSTLSFPQQTIIDFFPRPSSEISRHLRQHGVEWDAVTVDSERSRLRSRLKLEGLGQLPPDGRSYSTGRRRPRTSSRGPR